MGRSWLLEKGWPRKTWRAMRAPPLIVMFIPSQKNASSFPCNRKAAPTKEEKCEIFPFIPRATSQTLAELEARLLSSAQALPFQSLFAIWGWYS